MTIETYGTGKRLREAARLCSTLLPRHLILLPVPTTKDGEHVLATDIPLYDTLACATRESVVVGYGLPEGYKARAMELGARVLDLSLDEEFLLGNARLTALGTLAHILKEYDKAPEELSFGIFGYGRIGAELLRLLLFLGARVTVFSSRESTREMLAKCGVCSEGVGACNFSELDILINTAPRDMREYFPNGIPKHLAVIELASGKNFEGLCVTSLPALPEREFSASAGRLYFEAVRRATL